jgi:hypothetical protein
MISELRRRNRWVLAMVAGVVLALAAPAFTGGVVAEAAPKQKSRLHAGEVLRPDETLRSENGRFTLTQQRDGNLVLTGPGRKVLFDTKTAGNPGARSVLQNDGNFVVLSRSGRPLFDTRTAGNPGARLVVQDDCNVVLYAKDGRALWYAGSHVRPFPDRLPTPAPAPLGRPPSGAIRP